MEESPCLSIGCLREAFSKGRFADPAETLRALTHFAWPCQPCWRHLAALAADDSEINLKVLECHAAECLQEPPVALALGRLALAARQPAVAMALPPTHRYLVRDASWSQSFEFWWLLIEEARLLALGSADRQIERWQAMADALLRQSDGGESHDLELELLIRAYQADEIRIEGRPQAAGDLLADILARAKRCRPAIRATIYEVQADLNRVGWSNPSREEAMPG